jgi:hypothetical protein
VASAGEAGCSAFVEVGHQDRGRVIVLLAAAAGALSVGLGEFGLAGAADQFDGAVGGEEVEQLGPVGEMEALDETGGPVAEQRGAADGRGRERASDGLVGGVGEGAGDVEAAGAVAGGADAFGRVVRQVGGAVVGDGLNVSAGVEDEWESASVR